MPRLSLGLGVQNTRKVGGAAALITTSRAFNSSGVQVGTTNTGDIPENWVVAQATVTSVIFANNNSVTIIGQSAFQECTGLTSITIPNSVTSINESAFQNCTNLASITIPNSVTSIGAYAFKVCTSLTSITIPNSVTSIGNYAFGQCTSLTAATIGTGVTSIGNYAFQNCTSLISITIPNSVTSIGAYAFKVCTSLTTATIGTGVTSIGNYAFRDCTSLATVSCRVAQSAFTGSDAFYNTASPLVIQARSTDSSWTAGTGLTFQGNANVTVIKNL